MNVEGGVTDLKAAEGGEEGNDECGGECQLIQSQPQRCPCSPKQHKATHNRMQRVSKHNKEASALEHGTEQRR